MCGITGFWGKTAYPLRTIAKAMSDSLVHRGPDAAGIWCDEDASLVLAHRRLAVIELSETGAQPMISHDARYVLTFNGEFYNHRAMRQTLSQEGKTPNAWRGASDTETFLEYLCTFGLERALTDAVGMFALALWDRASRRLILARDRYGEKPLFYGWLGARGTFAFASELKALRAHPEFDNALDEEGVAQYLRFGYVPAPHAIYKSIFKLPPGAAVTMTESDVQCRNHGPHFYWRLEDVARRALAQPYPDETIAHAELEATLKSAIALQLEADVPVGTFLSGGIDSSLVTALACEVSPAQVKTYTIGFEKADFNEAPFARAVANHLGTAHHEEVVDVKRALCVIPDLSRIYDEPFGDSSQIPTHAVSRIARAHVTVALSGDGGDEVFGGYYRHIYGPRIWRALSVAPAPLRALLASGIRTFSPRQWNALSARLGLDKRFALLGDRAHKLSERLSRVRSVDELFQSLLTQWRLGEEPLLRPGARAAMVEATQTYHAMRVITPDSHRMMLLDALSYLPDDIMTKVDRASMSVSLETRAPFLDHRIAEVAWRMPQSMKIADGVGKVALRSLLYRRVPRALLERPKAGFGIPVGEWLRTDLRDWAEGLLSSTAMADTALLSPAPIHKIWREHLSGERDWTDRLWHVLMLQSWLQAQKRENAANSTIAETAP